ncbi:hypothetical protein DB32_005823 [Sandaracinus amylolyticus]|uniref:Uncharacterized protein n=1 Tax=Sandaracinus amylolyticus TaxID=927083 RepID=A0A0F6SGG9_9BACT|nr:hypothetical protein DB32_005823 [Sandaracinus amylolyticus]
MAGTPLGDARRDAKPCTCAPEHEPEDDGAHEILPPPGQGGAVVRPEVARESVAPSEQRSASVGAEPARRKLPTGAEAHQHLRDQIASLSRGAK